MISLNKKEAQKYKSVYVNTQLYLLLM